MNPYEPSGGFHAIQGSMPSPTGAGIQNPMQRSSMPMGQPQRFNAPPMQPSMGGQQFEKTMQPGMYNQPQDPNRAFPQMPKPGFGMQMNPGGQQMPSQAFGSMQGGNGMPQGMPPEILAQLLQLFGSNQMNQPGNRGF